MLPRRHLEEEIRPQVVLTLHGLQVRRGRDSSRRRVIKLVFCLTRKPDLSRAEFQAYWRETHAR